MEIFLATCSQFFRLGLEAGICTADAAREWALSVIAEMDDPPAEIIEVSWRKPLLHQLITDLNSVPGDVELETAGSWLLGVLSDSMSSTNGNPRSVITRAKQVALSMNDHVKDSELYRLFSGLETELDLAEAGISGAVDDCNAELAEVLCRHSLTPPPALLNVCR